MYEIFKNTRYTYYVHRIYNFVSVIRHNDYYFAWLVCIYRFWDTPCIKCTFSYAKNKLLHFRIVLFSRKKKLNQNTQ